MLLYNFNGNIVNNLVALQVFTYYVPICIHAACHAFMHTIKLADTAISDCYATLVMHYCTFVTNIELIIKKGV